MNILEELEAIKEVSLIENSKGFQRLSEKTQVLVPMVGREEVVKNRLTHSYEVSTSAKIISGNIAISHKMNSLSDIDYRNCLKQICLLHDIGHPPFGHDGAKILNNKIKEKGLSEGFSDNNNNLVLIEKQNIHLRDYVKSSIIKYPEKLYNEQKKIYLPILEKSIQEDFEHFSKLGIKLKNQKTTISCQIMDEADRNSYTCSDLSDFYCLGNKITLTSLEEFIDLSSNNQLMIAKKMVESINSGSKNEIKNFFNNMKNLFNHNLDINENGIFFTNKNLFKLRESFSKIEYEFFIKPIRQEEFHLTNIKFLNKFIDDVLDKNFCQSSYYKDKILNNNDPIEILKLKRDMISEVNDWYVINYNQNLENKQKSKRKIKP